MKTRQFIESAIEVHGNSYDYSNVHYVNNHTKVEIKCPIHGSFHQEPRSHISAKSGCPQCGGRVRSTTETFIKKAKSVHNGSYVYPTTKYVNARTKVQVLCPQHGVFEVTPDNHLRGRGCPTCYNERRKDLWQKKTEGELIEHGERIKAGYENMSEEDRIKMLNNKSASRKRWFANLSDEGKKVYGEKIKQGQENPEDGIPFSDKMKSYWAARTDDEIKAIGDKIKNTWSLKSEEEIKAITTARHTSQKMNGSFTQSKPEVRVYEALKSTFGEIDVFKEYRDDDRYPFSCDFYIKSLDLFIEVNAHWTHGGHFFNEKDAEDIKRLKQLKKKSKTSKFYENMIEVWTKRDPLKKKTAEEQGLNYLVFWENDLSDFFIWLEGVGGGGT